MALSGTHHPDEVDRSRQTTKNRLVMKPTPYLSLLLTGLVTPVLSGCDDAGSAVLTELGISWELAELRSATLSDVRYDYELRVPKDAASALEGSVVVDFAWSDPGRTDVILDFKDPGARVIAVRANGSPVDWRAVNDHVVVGTEALDADSRNRIDIDFVAGDEALNRNQGFLYTLFVPDRAHFSLPLFDQPNLKGRFTLALHVPEGWVAVANGEEVSRTETAAGEGGALYHFAETEPIPTYLFAFAVGDFQIETAERAGRTMRMFHRETDDEKVTRNREAIFDLHGVALDWLEEYTGIPYPFGKFDFVLIPPFQYGGMEHPGSIFYRQASHMLDESATQSQFLGRASVIAHETAHMWFGDLVTMNWFDDVWTKEVFANFMAAKIVHPSFPEIDHDLRFFLAHHNTAYGVDRTDGANPIRQPLENLREAGSLYGAIIYQKAPIVMRQLELLLGEELFRDGMRDYLDAFRYGNATWPDLIAILDRRSHADLAAWSQVWVEQPGRPIVVADIREDGQGRVTGLTLEQHDPQERDRVWPQRLEVLLAYDEETLRVPVDLTGPAAPAGDWIGRPRPHFVLPNGAGVEYGHFHLDSLSLGYLVANLPGLEDPMIRGIGWVTLWDAVLEGELAPTVWMDLLLRGLESESVEQNVQRILGYVGTAFWRLTGTEERRELSSSLEAALWAGIEGTASPTVASAYFRAWRGIVMSPAGVDRLERIWDESETVPGVPLSEPDFTALAEALAVRDVPDVAGILARQADRIENPDRKARFEFIRPALSSDQGVRAAFFADLSDPTNREREPWVRSGLGALHHPLRSEHSRQFILPSLALLEEIQRTGDIFFPKGWLDSTLGGHNSPEAAGVVRDFLEGLGPEYPARLRGKILQSADMFFRAAEIAH